MARHIAVLESRREFQARLSTGLVTQPIVLQCPSCRTDFSGSLEWRCGYCRYDNHRPTIYSFLYKCQKCDKEPKSFACPQCGVATALDADNDTSHPGCSVPKVATPKDPLEEKRREHTERKGTLVQEIEIARLTAELAQIKGSSESLSGSTLQDKLKQSFAEHEARVMGAHAIAKEQRSKNQERYKDDPEMLEMANEAVAHWLEDQLLQ